MFAQALARRLSRVGVHYGWAIAACLIAATAIRLVDRTQGARTRLVEARA